jgi:ubiquinone/menaquinone biosynthesis C-methylase UbiE
MGEQYREPYELPTRQGYDRWASIYDDDDNPLIALEHEQFVRVMANVRGLRVLDAGCGTGRHALWLGLSGARVTAVDFSNGMLARARAKPGAEGVDFLQHDLESPLPFADASFDRVVSGLVVDHMNHLADYFSELRRVCCAAGLVYISVMHPTLSFRGVQARFTDPETGTLTLPASRRHMISDYVMAALREGLSIRQLQEHLVDEAFAANSKRARRYLGWPMLLLMELTP